MSRRGSTILFTVGVTVLAVTGCAPAEPVACPAVAYMSTLEIVVDVPGAEDVLICNDDLCAPSRAASDAGVTVFPADVDGDVWTFTGQFPDGMTVEVYDAAGELLTSTGIDPDWHRTGGSEECGGPAEASVTVRV
ncbi:MAG: hypothetical protein WBX17_08260 [Microbacterium sp.]